MKHSLYSNIFNQPGSRKTPAVSVPFYRPSLTGLEQEYINNVLSDGKLSGNGNYTQQCCNYFKKIYGVKNCLLTSTYTETLNLAVNLLKLQPADEIIVPACSANALIQAFERHGATMRYADCNDNCPVISAGSVEALVSANTKVIVVTHYAGIAADMDAIMEIAHRHNILVLEDASQSIDACYKNQTLGTIGHIGIMSFHEGMNITCGEGGLLMVNDDSISLKSDTDCTPNEITAAFLYAQLQDLQKTQAKRLAAWNRYYEELKELEVLGFAKMPLVPDYAIHNAHRFYLSLPDKNIREKMKQYLAEVGVATCAETKRHVMEGSMAEHFAQSSLCLPLYADITLAEQKTVVNKIWRFFLRK